MIEDISYEEVRNIASNIKNSANRVNEILQSVDNEMSTKVGSGEIWSSSASESYYTTFKELAAKFQGFYNELCAYSDFLDATVVAYEENDAKIANSAMQ